MTRLEQYSLDDPLTRSLTAQQSYTYDEDIPNFTREGIHLASVVERKRLWWRNATINTLFIGSWYVLLAYHQDLTRIMFSLALGLLLPLSFLCITNGCSRRSTLASHFHYL